MTRTTDDTERDRPTMGAVSHTNPYTNETAGQLFSRGPIVRADGGAPAADGGDDAAAERANADGRAALADETERNRPMKDVSHTPPKDAADANRVFERGAREATGATPGEREE